MGETINGDQSEEPGGAFNRVNAAEDVVHQVDVDVGAVGFNLQKLLLNVAQMVARFGNKLS